MEVKIGIQQAPREITFESAVDQAKLTKTLKAAWTNKELVTFEDEKGRTIVIPTDKITYIEFGAPKQGHVGFGG